MDMRRLGRHVTTMGLIGVEHYDGDAMINHTGAKQTAHHAAISCIGLYTLLCQRKGAFFIPQGGIAFWGTVS